MEELEKYIKELREGSIKILRKTVKEKKTNSAMYQAGIMDACKNILDYINEHKAH